jgi:hypothetical protein
VQPVASAGKDLGRDLVDRPVPRRDEAAHADRLLLDQGRAALRLELIILEHSDRGLEVADADRRLGPLGERGGRAHLLGDRLGDLGVALLIFGGDRLEQVEPLLAGRLGIDGKAALAAATARSTSSAEPRLIRPATLSSAGLMTSSVFASAGFTHSPPM